MKRKTVVKKFGGTSVGSIDRIESVADRILENWLDGEHPVIVLSAMSGETNRLIQMANEVDPKSRGAAFDMLLASGEQVSIALLAMSLNKRGLQAKPFLAYQLGIKTDDVASKAKIQSIEVKKLDEALERGVIPIVAGFQGISGSEITTLGRGGSDTTAVALSVALKLSECEIYTDVTAIYSADPRLVSKASKIKSLGFNEMMEMSSLGSKVLHSRCVELAAKFNIQIHLRSSFEEQRGTLVLKRGENMESPIVTAVTHEMTTAIIKIFPVPKGIKALSDLFERLSDESILVDIITQSYNEEGQRLAFSINEEDIEKAKLAINKTFTKESKISVLRDVAKLSVVGVGMKNHFGVASKFFKCLSDSDIDVYLVTTSDIKISVIIDSVKLKEAAQIIHSEFGLDKK